MTFDQLNKMYEGNIYPQDNIGGNPVVGNAVGINSIVPAGGTIGKFPSPNWVFGPSGQLTLGSPPTDKEEIIFKSETIKGLHYELKAELRNEDVILIGIIYSNGELKTTQSWGITKDKIQFTIIEAHKWAQGIIEKKSNAIELFEKLVDKGKKESPAHLAMCLIKYIPS